MKAALLQLPDGRTLEERRGAWILQPDGITVAVGQAGDELRVTDPDTGELVYAGPLATEPAGRTAGTRSAKASQASQSKWHTYNDFIDSVAPSLDPVEAMVWLHIFRRMDASTGLAKMALAALADRLGRSERTIIRAVDKLLSLGVLERVTRGSRQGGGSVYRLAASPSAAVAGKAARRPASRRPGRRSQHDSRDGQGRYSKPAMGVGS